MTMGRPRIFNQEDMAEPKFINVPIRLYDYFKTWAEENNLSVYSISRDLIEKAVDEKDLDVPNIGRIDGEPECAVKIRNIEKTILAKFKVLASVKNKTMSEFFIGLMQRELLSHRKKFPSELNLLDASGRKIEKVIRRKKTETNSDPSEQDSIKIRITFLPTKKYKKFQSFCGFRGVAPQVKRIISDFVKEPVLPGYYENSTDRSKTTNRDITGVNKKEWTQFKLLAFKNNISSAKLLRNLIQDFICKNE